MLVPQTGPVGTISLIDVVTGLPFIAPKLTRARVPQNWTCAGGGAIYLGFGLSTPAGVSEGLPFDALSMLLTAEQIRVCLQQARLVVHVADAHALEANPHLSPEAILVARDRVLRELQSVRAAFGLSTMLVTLASDVGRLTEYRSLVEAIPSQIDNIYARREIADIAWHAREFGTRLKLGWTISDRPDGGRRDEAWFDRLYVELFGTSDMAFAYTEPGRNDDPARPRCTPYTLLPGQFRIPLAMGEPARSPASENHRAYLARVCAVAESFVGGVAGSNLPARIDRVRNLVAVASPN